MAATCGHLTVDARLSTHVRRQDIVNPIKKFGYIGAGRTAFSCLKRDVLDKILLRRTKAGRADEMVLPPKVVTIEANFLVCAPPRPRTHLLLGISGAQ